MQSVPINIDVVSSNLDQDEVHNFRGPPVSSTNKTDRHDITEISLNRHHQTSKQTDDARRVSSVNLFKDDKMKVNYFFSSLYQFSFISLSRMYGSSRDLSWPLC